MRVRRSLAPQIVKRLPVLRTVGELSRWLGVSPRELTWLCDFSRSGKHYRCHWVKKRSSGWRLLESPKPKLKIVQKQILSEILNLIPAHPLACGFCPGKNILDFAQPHHDREVCLKMDLRDFFHHVRTGRVCGLFRTAGYGRSVSHYLAMLTTTQVGIESVKQHHPDFLGTKNPISKLLRFRRLPQGAPTSPAIANHCAFRMDVRLAALARQFEGVHFTRYADDLLFSGGRRFVKSVNRFQITVGSIAIEEGFDINFRKTRIMKKHQRQKAGGVVLNRKLNFDRRDFDRLKAILTNCVRDGLESQNREQHPHFREHLMGRIQWVELLNRQRGFKLREIFDRIDK